MLTKEDLKLIADTFGLEFQGKADEDTCTAEEAEEVTYKVRDGIAKVGDTVWWLCVDGPEKQVVGDEKWYDNENEDNVIRYPDAYQLAEPEVVGKTNEGYVIYDHQLDMSVYEH